MEADWGPAPQELCEALISVHRSGDYVTRVSPEDLELLRQYPWTLHRCNRGKKLYARCKPTIEGKRPVIYMHRLVCSLEHGPPPSKRSVADHRDGDGLHNTRGNLFWNDKFHNRWRTKSWG